MKQITFIEYIELLEIAKVNFPNVAENVNTPANDKGTKFFKSSEGCSALKNGFLFGLFRFKKGSEKIAKIHQQKRILEGGYFLECYEGVLSNIYKKQGFKIVSRLKFDPLQAPKNWEQNEVLKNSPDVVFMSLFAVNEIKIFDNYNQASTVGKFSKPF